MQTYFCEPNPRDCAQALDRRRLGKQRIEALQIARILTGTTEKVGWSNHPITRSWAHHVPYLVHVYLPAMLDEWEARGFESTRTRAAWAGLAAKVGGRRVKPPWVTDTLVASHRAYLKRRDPAFYGTLWPGVPAGLPLVWPVSTRGPTRRRR